MHCADAVFTKCIYWDRDIVICFEEVLKDPNTKRIIEQINTVCLYSVEQKDLSGTSKTKTKLENLLHPNVGC